MPRTRSKALRRFFKRIGAKGGQARAKRLPPAARAAIARKAALARWKA